MVQVNLGIRDLDNLKLQEGLVDNANSTFLSIGKGAIKDMDALLDDEVSQEYAVQDSNFEPDAT